jgi:hypothetical protein
VLYDIGVTGGSTAANPAVVFLRNSLALYQIFTVLACEYDADVVQWIARAGITDSPRFE